MFWCVVLLSIFERYAVSVTNPWGESKCKFLLNKQLELAILHTKTPCKLDFKGALRRIYQIAWRLKNRQNNAQGYLLELCKASFCTHIQLDGSVYIGQIK